MPNPPRFPASKPPTPRWVKVFGIIAAVAILLIVILLLIGGHRPPVQHGMQ